MSMSKKTQLPESEAPSVSLLHGWQDMLHPMEPISERIARGKSIRKECPRSAHGEWTPRRDRSDPLSLLASQDEMRIKHLLPLRYARMMRSPFAFFRATALITASDLSHGARTNLFVQLCGDCHLSNFGIFATPERNVIFDLNDFDETLPGPFEWDLKRLATSFVVAAKDNGFSESVGVRCVQALAQTYRREMEELAFTNTLDIWYGCLDYEELIKRIKKPGRRQNAMETLERMKDKRSHAGALAKLTEVVDGKRRIKDDPPLIYHNEVAATPEIIMKVLQAYGKSLWESRQRLLERYHFVDFAAKVVGVGSVGTLAAVVLLQGEGGDEDYIFLQVKQAIPSVLEKYIGKSQFTHPGQRVVNGQRLLQAASDMFLGWTSGPLRDFYVRQLMDVKMSIPIDELDETMMVQYAEVCADVLARAHARSGDPAVIFGYLGKSGTMDDALAKFAVAYAKQNDEDFGRLVDAIDKGRINAAYPAN